MKTNHNSENTSLKFYRLVYRTTYVTRSQSTYRIVPVCCAGYSGDGQTCTRELQPDMCSIVLHTLLKPCAALDVLMEDALVLEYALVMWDGLDQDVIKVMCKYTTLILYEARKL